MIKNFEQLKEMLKAMPVKRKVAVVPAQDEHTLEAISHAYRDGMVEPVLIGDEPKIREILAQIGTDADKMTIIHVEDPTEAIQKAADMARDGEVDCIMKGKTETGALMKVLVNRERGIRKNDTMSLLAFMESPNYHKVFAITDVGLLTYPSKDQKKAAIQNAVEAFHALGVEQPKVAILAAVEKVNHPSLPDHPDHALYEKYFPNGGGSIFTFNIKGGVEEAHKFIDNLQVFSLLANVADVKSLVIHPATTTHSQLTEEELADVGIQPNTIRLSIGTEHIDDILFDLKEALDQI